MSSFSKKEVNIIFNENPQRIKTEWFDLIISLCKEDLSKILIVTSRKIGNAPKRNKIRRQLKAIFHEEKLYTQKINCIVIAKKAIFDLSFVQLKDIFLKIHKEENDKANF